MKKQKTKEEIKIQIAETRLLKQGLKQAEKELQTKPEVPRRSTFGDYRPATREAFARVNSILDEYSGQMTVRQVYYQFFSRGWLPKLKFQYNWMVGILSKGRWSEKIDYERIVDTSRDHFKNAHFKNPAEALHRLTQIYKIDTRSDQEFYIEVWIEKMALIGVIEETCRQQDVLFLACKGFDSVTKKYEHSKRFIKADKENKMPIVFYLGDLDPSGKCASDILPAYLREHHKIDIHLERIALTDEQVEEYELPGAPIEIDDTRTKKYLKEYGTLGWELDALPYGLLNDLINNAINKVTDLDKRKQRLAQQERDLEKLAEIVSHTV